MLLPQPQHHWLGLLKLLLWCLVAMLSHRLLLLGLANLVNNCPGLGFAFLEGLESIHHKAHEEIGVVSPPAFFFLVLELFQLWLPFALSAASTAPGGSPFPVIFLADANGPSGLDESPRLVTSSVHSERSNQRGALVKASHHHSASSWSLPSVDIICMVPTVGLGASPG